ncbi:MAG: GlsB/YeaQ/YmgE family stress response membrane protein [Candidatus Paceibacterota bacterium]|jgi:uncharacterized membrane protein YeaQ/YmgE (transglycosylase-associated protein family)
MGIILWIIFGGLVGWIASIIMGTNQQQGMLLNIIVGIFGAVIGGWFFGHGAVNSFSLYSFMVALIGSIVLITIVKLLRRV